MKHRQTPEPIMPPRVSLLVPLLILLGVLLVCAGNARAAVTPTCDGVPATIFKADGSPGRLAGTGGDDVIVGSIGRDTIEAGGGDDLICAVDGRDAILGGTGTDRIYAGSGDDEVESGAGTGDDVYGGEGRDLVTIDSFNSAANG
jgi:Ca2+-binding RTX toxin-like protein